MLILILLSFIKFQTTTNQPQFVRIQNSYNLQSANSKYEEKDVIIEFRKILIFMQ